MPDLCYHPAGSIVRCMRCDINLYCRDCAFRITPFSEDYCNACFEEQSTSPIDYCGNCNEYEIDCYKCSNCAGCCSCYIHLYEYKPERFKFYGKNGKTNDIFMGIELEVENTGNTSRKDAAKHILDIANPFIYCKDDGSLEDGIEIVSHPATLQYHLTSGYWDLILKFLKEKLYKSHDTETCGLHVHVGKKELTALQTSKIKFFTENNIEFVEALSRRTRNSYCRAIGKKKQGIKVGQYLNTTDRYEAVNLTNESTIEFRTFRGTLNKNTLFATLEYIYLLVKFVDTISVIQSLEENVYLKYIEFISGKTQYLENYLVRVLGISKKQIDKTEGENVCV